jgi:hypothetical protein
LVLGKRIYKNEGTHFGKTLYVVSLLIKLN